MHGGRGAMCGALPRCRALACLSVPTTSVPFLKSDGVHAPSCSNDCLYRHTTLRITETQTAYDPQREILRMRANQVRVTQTSLNLGVSMYNMDVFINKVYKYVYI
jgi:hypothetical protein